MTLVEITGEAGSKALCKPIGRYATLSLPGDLSRQPEACRRACLAAAALLRELCPPGDTLTLVAGLGNRDITPDCIGPAAARRVIATRHLAGPDGRCPSGFSPVAVLEPGVLGATGMESAELIRAAAELTGAGRIIAVDALAAAEPERLCATLQISDTGLVPGSGVGNRRGAVTEETQGVPVVALGVPTVIDAAAFSRGSAAGGDLLVTPRDIDRRAAEAARVAGIAIDLALHPGLTYEEAQLLAGDCFT